MLTDAREIEIISQAQQKNVRDPNRSREHFERIFEDFFGHLDWQGKRFLDLGPGQYDFAEMARSRGAQVYNVDRDPAVVALGKYKGFPVIEGDLTQLKPEWFDERFDGIFCKYSINAFWFSEDSVQQAYLQGLGQLLKDDGWVWIGPWNGGHEKYSSEDQARILQVQAQGFAEWGCWGVELTDALSTYYGIHGTTGNRALFGRNLPKPSRIKACPAVIQKPSGMSHWLRKLVSGR